ncbi:MAG: GNAT family N-acetyltransferase [Chloroflexota bacterium]
MMGDTLLLRPITAVDVRQFIYWQYEAPYDVYNIATGELNETAVAQEITYFLDPAINCHAIIDQQGMLQAFCTFGKDAQVPGGDYSQDALDIGLGVRPDRTGQGQGYRFVAAVIEFAQKTFQPTMLRVTIAEFNERAKRVWLGQGFVEGQRFTAVSWTKRPFIIFTRPAFPA